MSRPLLVTDCDEVLLHMVRHFRDWLAHAHGVDFALGHRDFASAMTRADGSRPSAEEMWALLGGFFPGEMARQTLVPGAAEALAAIGGEADVVVLTNLQDHCRAARIEQLAGHGVDVRVETNQGGKGAPVAALMEEFTPTVAVFVDDLAVHHASVAKHAPEVWRLHLIAEPELARVTPPAPDTHARIDDWREAERWIAARFAAGRPAPAPTEASPDALTGAQARDEAAA